MDLHVINGSREIRKIVPQHVYTQVDMPGIQTLCKKMPPIYFTSIRCPDKEIENIPATRTWYPGEETTRVHILTTSLEQ